MERYKRHEDFDLNRIFFKELRESGKSFSTASIATMYFILFSKLDPEDLNHELEYINDLRLGKDEMWGEESKDSWFGIFHKGVRTADYFQNIFVRKEMKLIDDTELKEMRHLKGLLIDKKIEKRDENRNFTKEYRRYLDLYDLKRRQTIEEDISGSFDSLLWNLVHVDTEGVLYKTFELTFEKYRIENLEPVK